MGCPGHEHWHPDPESFYLPGGGPILDTGLTYLSALVSLLGPIARVSGSARMSATERTITSEKKRGQKIPVQVPTHISGSIDFTSGVTATLIQSYDLAAHQLPALEIYGTKGTLSLPDPTTFDDKLKIRLLGSGDWEDVALTHPKGLGRGLGVADMAYAITHNRPHRANETFAYHVLDAALALEESSQANQHFGLASTCERPAALPHDLAANEFDF
jgi:predicted dehydrogenase